MLVNRLEADRKYLDKTNWKDSQHWLNNNTGNNSRSSSSSSRWYNSSEDNNNNTVKRSHSKAPMLTA